MEIQLSNLSKCYGEPPKTVFSNLNMELRVGMNTLMGPSGIGKTTIANILAGLTKPDSGDVVMKPQAFVVSCVFQEERLLEYMSAIKNVLLVCPEGKKKLQAAKELLCLAGLGDALNKQTAELSGGMKRRVSLCRALIAEHDLLILDEPFKGLDAGIKPKIMQMVKDDAKGKIVLCITHDAEEAEFLGGRMLRLPA